MIDSWPILFCHKSQLQQKSAGEEGGVVVVLGWRGVRVEVVVEVAGGGGVANVAALFLRSLFPSCSLLDAL